jgi:hypothetical protein
MRVGHEDKLGLGCLTIHFHSGLGRSSDDLETRDQHFEGKVFLAWQTHYQHPAAYGGSCYLSLDAAESRSAEQPSFCCLNDVSGIDPEVHRRQRYFTGTENTTSMNLFNVPPPVMPLPYDRLFISSTHGFSLIGPPSGLASSIGMKGGAKATTKGGSWRQPTQTTQQKAAVFPLRITIVLTLD